MKPGVLPTKLGFVLLLFLSFLSPVSIAAPPKFCATAHPEDVLRCLSQVYEQRDPEGYALLLAPDYAAYYEENPSPISTRVVELSATKDFFNPDSVKSLSLTFGNDFTVAQGDSANLWVLSNVNEVLTIDSVRKGKLEHHEVTNSRIEVKIRRVITPEPHFQIYRWWVKPAK